MMTLVLEDGWGNSFKDEQIMIYDSNSDLTQPPRSDSPARYTSS